MSNLGLNILLSVGGLVVGALITYLVARRFRPRKEITLIVPVFESTFEVTEFVKDKVAIKYKNKIVESLERISLIILNSGNQGIKGEDFVEPLKVVLPKGAQIVEIRKQQTCQAEVSVKRLQNVLQIDFDLLNPNETIPIELLATKSKGGRITCEGRGANLHIKDFIPAIKRGSEKKAEFLLKTGIILGGILVFLAVGSIIWGIFFHSTKGVISVAIRVFEIVSLVFGLISLALFSLIKANFDKQKRFADSFSNFIKQSSVKK